MAKFLVGQIVRVLPEKYEARWLGCFNKGDEVKIIEIEHRPNEPVKIAYLLEDGIGYQQLYCEEEIELIQTTLPVKASREAIQKEDTVTTAIPKTDIKTLYTVVKNGETHYYGYDREKARQEKADLGGLAAGAEIIQFKPVKTVR